MDLKANITNIEILENGIVFDIIIYDGETEIKTIKRSINKGDYTKDLALDIAKAELKKYSQEVASSVTKEQVETDLLDEDIVLE
jgi:hypothetical protein